MEAKKFRARKLSKNQKNVKRVLYYQDLSYISKLICSKLISYHHNNFLASYFETNGMHRLIAKTYYELILCQDVDPYIKNCNIHLASKTICHKPYGHF